MADAPTLAGLYYNEIARTPVVRDPAEERRLTKRWQKDGDVAARDAIINSHLRFVVRQAHKKTKDPVAVQDYIAAGNVGLLKAIDRFDPDRKPYIRFLTYAGWWVHKEMSDHDYATSSLVHVPTHRQKERRRAARAKRAVDQMRGPGHSEPELDPAAGFVVGLDSVEDDAIDDGETAEEACHGGQLRVVLSRALDALPLRESLVLKLHFGFRGEPRNLVQIASIMGTTPEWVRQIKVSGLRLLRDELGDVDPSALSDDEG